MHGQCEDDALETGISTYCVFDLSASVRAM